MNWLHVYWVVVAFIIAIILVSVAAVAYAHGVNEELRRLGL